MKEKSEGGCRGFQKPLITFSYCCFFLKGANTRAIISVTESRSQKYLLANSPLPETQSEILTLPDCSTLNHWIVALRERHAHVPRCFLTTICQHILLKSNFRLIRHCMGHTPASCKTLANSFYSSTWKKMSNESEVSGQGTLSQSPAKVSAIIITVCTQSGCVLSYSLSQSSEETREFGTDFPRGQDSPNIQYQHSSNPSLCFHWRDETRHRNRGDAPVMALITLVSSLGDHVWEWKWLSQQKIGSLFISAFVSLLDVLLGWITAADKRNLSDFLMRFNLYKAIRSNYEHLTLQHRRWWWDPQLQQCWANFPSQFVCLSSEQAGVQCMEGLPFFSQWNFPREESLTTAFYRGLLPQSETFFRRFTKHLQICTKHEDCGRLHSDITVWSLAGFLLGLLRAIQTVTHLYSASGWSWLNYYNVTIFLHAASQD